MPYVGKWTTLSGFGGQSTLQMLRYSIVASLLISVCLPAYFRFNHNYPVILSTDHFHILYMFCRIHFVHEILLNLSRINRKNKLSYHVFMLLSLVHEVHMRNQEPRTNNPDWSIQISYALNHIHSTYLAAKIPNR